MLTNESFRTEFGAEAFIELMDIFTTGDSDKMQCISIGHTSPLSKDVYLKMCDVYIHAHYTMCMTDSNNMNGDYNVEILEYGTEITMPLGSVFDDHRRNMRINKIIVD